MIKKGIFISLWLTFLFVVVQAQYKISGHVINAGHTSLSAASVALLQDSLFLSGTITDEKGHFELIYHFEKGKHYSLQFSLTGYQSLSRGFSYPDTVVLQSVVLLEDNTALATVTVTAKKPLVIRKVDRYIVDVENSFLANGNSGLEVLQKSPGIWVSSDGSIRIKGGQSVMVMINDVVQRMSGEELAEYLKTLKSEDISRIEVIENPPSEFEAAGSGGIIHIILKKARKDGVNGSVNAQYRQQGTKPYIRAGTSLDYKVKSLYLSGNLSISDDQSRYTGSNRTGYSDKNLVINNSSIRINDNRRQQYRFGIVYDLSKNQTIGIQTIGATSQLVQSFLTTIHYTTSRYITGVANSEWIRKPRQNSTTLNYVWKMDTLGSTLKIVGDYTSSSKTETNDFAAVYNDSISRSRYKNSSPNKTNIYSLQADYTKALNRKTEFKSGLKYTLVYRDNMLVNEDYINDNWVFNPLASNHFLYDETLLMLYASMEKTLGKASIKAGLRAEETLSKGNTVTSGQGFSRKYFGLFPSLFITQRLDETKGTSLYLNYSRRLQRPAFNELNPYRLQFDNFTSMVGNPDLLPQYTHTIEAGYLFLPGYSAAVYLSSTRNIIAQLSNPVSDSKIEYQYQNFNRSKEYGVTLNAPFKILKGWTSNNTLFLYHLSYRIQDFDIHQTSFSAKSIHNLVLKNLFDVDAYVEYRSPYVNANSRMASIFYTEFGVTKKVWKNQARFRLSVADIFNVVRERETISFKTIHIDSYQKRPTRIASVSFTYNFSSGKKFSNRKIEESSSDEKNRIGN